MMESLLLKASIDGAVLVAIVWTLTRLLPRMRPGTRTLLWWCAATKFVVTLAWTNPVVLPVLPAAHVAVEDASVLGSMTTPQISSSDSIPIQKPTTRLNWTNVLLAGWASGVILSVGIGVRRWRRVKAIVRRSTAAPSAIADLTADLAALLGLSRVPPVHVSTDVETPLVAGLLRPVLLLPSDRFLALSERQQRLALCHELAHVKR